MSYIGTIHRHTPSLKWSFKLSQKTQTSCSLWGPGSAPREWSRGPSCGECSKKREVEWEGNLLSGDEFLPGLQNPQYEPELLFQFKLFQAPSTTLSVTANFRNCLVCYNFIPFHFLIVLSSSSLLTIVLQLQLCETYFRKSGFWKEGRTIEERREGEAGGREEGRKKRKREGREGAMKGGGSECKEHK